MTMKFFLLLALLDVAAIIQGKSVIFFVSKPYGEIKNFIGLYLIVYRILIVYRNKDLCH